MISQNQMRQLFQKLNSRLKSHHQKGEIGLVGGAVMCLVFNARASTKDVDAIFEPAQVIRRLAQEIAEEESLPKDWLNDGAKAFIQPQFQRQIVLNLSNLLVWAPEAQYMLAMKCISARWDSSDKDDVIFLLRHLDLKSLDEVIKIIEKYYPKSKVPSKTQFFLEEILDS